MKSFIAFISSSVILISACGVGGSADNSDFSGTSSSTVERLTDGTSLSIDEAGSKYVDIVRDTNCAVVRYGELERQHSLGNNQIDMKYISDFTRAMQDVAAARKVAMGALVKTAWPGEVAEDVSAMAVFWSSLQGIEASLGSATDVGLWNTSMSQYLNLLSAPDAGRAKIIRIKLNLGDFDPSTC